MSKKYIVALDQGTTSSRAIIFDKEQNIVAVSQKEITQIYPKEGFVEQDPMEIWSTQYGVLQEVLMMADIEPEELAAIGITNQRETVVVWNKKTGKPLYNAIVWQCRRTAEFCEELKERGLEEYIRKSTGLVVDAYFSGSKIKWILDNVEGAREQAENGELLFGTIDTWLVWKLTGGRVHVTDYTNASRTMLFNIVELEWDEKLLNEFNIPKSMLPQVKLSSMVYGYAEFPKVRVPISGIAGDQQAALFGQGCVEEGEAKNTYGTGCFLLMNTGTKNLVSKNGLITTIAINKDCKPCYALEGSIFVGGAVVKWLRDELRLIQDPEDTEYFANSIENSGGVIVVPGFVGLGAPYWDMYARGGIMGLTRGSGRKQIIRASLESIGYQTKDVIQAMEEDTGISLKDLRVDGGASLNNFIMQFQSDILGSKVIRTKITESTALGAAYLAGLAVGFWESQEQLEKGRKTDREFNPSMRSEDRENLYVKWKKAVSRVLEWEE
ncbi:MAG: glycerol kinase GlpK [Filifactoraceae bacterium]